MAGERLHPAGHTEISAVCTDPAHRGQGLARRLVLAVAHGIRARGEIPFLHASAGNDTAIRLYRALGFELRRRVEFAAVTTPGRPSAGPGAAAPQPSGHQPGPAADRPPPGASSPPPPARHTLLRHGAGRPQR
jgi:hypothetical protein